MAESTIDTREWEAGLAKLADPAMRESLARSMAVAGGQVLRDEAKLQAPVESGLLKSAIYLAHKEGKSTDSRVVYSVTWNAKKAPHGHLLEFGHWQPFVTIKVNGQWVSTNKRREQPKWVSARPFLRPAYDIGSARAQDAMIQRGRERLPQLLAGTESA